MLAFDLGLMSVSKSENMYETKIFKIWIFELKMEVKY